jgi:hypothetical protein
MGDDTTPPHESDQDRLLQRLAGVLSMAEGSDNEAEREAFMVKAQILSTRYSIDLATARAHATFKNTAAQLITCDLIIGPRGKHGLANYVLLAAEIAEANNLKVTVASDNTRIYLFGFQEDITLTRQLFGSLLSQMVKASEHYLVTGAYKQEPIWRQVTRKDEEFGWRYREWDFAPVSKQTARSNFQKSFADRIGFRLREAKNEAETEAVAAEPGTALVLVDKSRQVAKFFETNSDAKGYWKGVRSSDWSESAHNATALARLSSLALRLALRTSALLAAIMRKCALYICFARRDLSVGASVCSGSTASSNLRRSPSRPGCVRAVGSSV